MPEVLDYSAGWPRNLGTYAGTVRYIGTPGKGKNLSLAELAARRQAGIPTAFVYESTAGWMLNGRDWGVHAGEDVLADLLDLGMTLPTFPGVFAACDVDAQPADLFGIDECLRGMASVLGADKVSVYGGFRVIEHCVGSTARLGWQTRAWSGGNVSTKACLLQQIGYVNVDGVQCDRNTVLKDDWGQYPSKEIDDMTPEEHAWLEKTRELIAVINHQIQNVLNPKVTQALTVLDAVRPETFAAAVVAQLPANVTGGVTREDIVQAVRAASAAAWGA